MSPGALFNGSRRMPDLAHHRGLHYGDGVFRTCLIYAGQVIDITKQIQKVSDDARRLGLRPDRGALRRELRAIAKGQAHGVAKVLLLRAGGERGYLAPGEATDRLVLRYPARAFGADCWEQGIAAKRAGFALAEQPRLAGIKHLNKLEQVLVSTPWPADALELILDDARGRPVCGSRSNLFWVRRGQLRTPALDRCGVAGVMRDKVLALARKQKRAVRIAAGSWRELRAADEAFVTNSLVGIWPLRRLGAQRWDAPGPVTRALMRGLDHPRVVSG